MLAWCAEFRPQENREAVAVAHSLNIPHRLNEPHLLALGFRLSHTGHHRRQSQSCVVTGHVTTYGPVINGHVTGHVGVCNFFFLFFF